MARRDCGQFTWWDRDDADHHLHDDDNHYTLFVPALLLSARCASVSKDVPVPDANTALHGPLRNRDTFIRGRAEITAFLTAKWNRELEYALRKNLWCFDENRIAVRFQYECHDRDGQWWRTYCNELWEFDEHGLMVRREASINDVAIDEQDRRILGPACGTSYPCGRPPRGDGQALASSIARLPGGAPAPGPHRRCPA